MSPGDSFGASTLICSSSLSSLGPRWHRTLAVQAIAAALIPAVVLTLFVPSVRGAAATALDYLSLKLDDSREVVLEGKLLCRDCPLEKEYGYHAMCPLTGHHGAIVTNGGRIWNILEGEKSHELIHNSSLLGRRVWVEGRMCRKAGSVAVSDYHNLLSGTFSRFGRISLPRRVPQG